MTTVSAIVVTRNRKDMLDSCLKSILAGSFAPSEIIIVDSGSTDGTADLVSRKYPSAKVVRSEKNLFLAAARNLGMKQASGDCFLVVDDDNEVHPNMIAELVRLCESDPSIGIAGPKMYYYGTDNLICFAGGDISPISSRTYYRGSVVKDTGQFDVPCETGHIPNLMIVKRTVVDRIGGFDETYRQTFADSDFPMRAKRAGFKVMYCPAAMTWHKALLHMNSKPDGSNVMLFRSAMRAYYQARNRVVYMKRFSKWWQFLVFFMVFFPLSVIYYTLKALQLAPKSEIKHIHDYSALKMHLLGSWDGLLYGLGAKLRDRYGGVEPD